MLSPRRENNIATFVGAAKVDMLLKQCEKMRTFICFYVKVFRFKLYQNRKLSFAVVCPLNMVR